MLLVQVRTTFLPPAQAAEPRVEVRTVPAVEPEAVEDARVRAAGDPAPGASQVAVQVTAALAAQIAVLEVSVMVPDAAMLFWVVKVNTMLVGVAAATRV